MTAIGIDLGTAYSCVGVYYNSRVNIITNDIGNRTTPSYVAFTDESILVGDEAKNQAIINPTNTIYGILGLIGRKFTDPMVRHLIKFWPFKVVSYKDEKPYVEVQFKRQKQLFSPEAIIAMILIKMKTIAESYLNQKVTDAVISVPADFGTNQRQCIINSGQIAGLNVIRLIANSSAAAITFGYKVKSTIPRKVLICDYGAYLSEVTNVDINGECFDVNSISYQKQFSGDNIDDILVNYFNDRFMKKYKYNLYQSPRGIVKLRTACREAKKMLSTAKTASINCYSIYNGIDYNDTISYSMFEEITKDSIKFAVSPVEQALKEFKTEKTEITDIVLIGGSSRFPKIQELLQGLFKDKKISHEIDPDESVAYGAALYAASLKYSIEYSIYIFGIRSSWRHCALFNS